MQASPDHDIQCLVAGGSIWLGPFCRWHRVLVKVRGNRIRPGTVSISLRHSLDIRGRRVRESCLLNVDNRGLLSWAQRTRRGSRGGAHWGGHPLLGWSGTIQAEATPLNGIQAPVHHLTPYPWKKYCIRPWRRSFLVIWTEVQKFSSKSHDLKPQCRRLSAAEGNVCSYICSYFMYICSHYSYRSGLCLTHVFFGLTLLWLMWQPRWFNSDSTL